MEEQFLTKEGIEKTKKLLQEHIEKRKEISERIQIAKELGDLSENAEYSEAKDSQAMNEGEISRLQDVLKHATLISAKDSGGIVVVGSTIEVSIKGKKQTYMIVGSSEANPAEGKISNVSPIGKAFLGKKKGDTTEIHVPNGTMKATISNVS